MAAAADPNSSSSSSIFSLKNSRPPDDTVFYSIFPDSSLNATTTTTATAASVEELQSLHLQILNHLTPYTSPYIWQHQPFTLSPSFNPIPHLSGHLRFGDNLEDEWFVVFLLFETSRSFPNLSIRVWDSDGDFLLIECAFHLPKWINPDTSPNRVFIRRGLLHIVSPSHFPTIPDLLDSLKFLISNDRDTQASEAIQLHLSKKIGEYPERAYRNMHRARVIVPVSVAWVLKKERSFVSLAVEGFYDRDIDSMKDAAKMKRFLPKGKEEEMVEVVISMPRAMYAQLVQQKFQSPRIYPMPASRSDVGQYMEAELGMKIACGFEMMYQLRKREGEEGKGSTWEAFRESLERSGYFEGMLPGSKEYKRLMEKAEEYYRNSSLHSRASEMLSSPVRRIDEILALPHSAEDLKGQELPPSDDDSWLYGGEDELNAALQERQKEMELYDLKRKKKQMSKEQQDGDPASTKDLEEYDLGDIANSMQAFVKKVSSYKGAEVPQNRNMEDVNFDVDQFMKDMESVMRHRGSEDTGSDPVLEEEPLSDMDFDESDDESEISEDNEDRGDTFMQSYSDALNEELMVTTLNKTFVPTHEQSMKKKEEGTSNATEDMKEFTPVDVDINLVQNFLDSFSSQQGLPGPASNLLGLMGLKLPEDSGKSK
ncbi:Protein SGT1-like protein [Forsythia ovata]|uniref:Protein SGT1-like protein n=1 Tax=Forsythia ovata TaxID=205694 RepID=A0ABD1WW49_9LAMI